MSAKLFETLTLRSITLANRIAVSPMCQYCSPGGIATPWHHVHLGSRAVGGAGLVFTEATAITPEGRISPDDLGIWSDAHRDALKPIVHFIKEQGARAGIQLGHAGRKASTSAPWLGGKTVPKSEGGWIPVGPSALAMAHHVVPRVLEQADLDGLVEAFVAATRRALEAGFEVIEVHAAHGYLLHEFLSPIANQRTDEYGGSLENRMRFPLRVIKQVRAAWPAELPLLVRISATDWHPDGWKIEDSVEFSRQCKLLGVDLMDCSTGGIIGGVKIPNEPGYQVQFAETVRKHADIPTGAVGLITEPVQAEQIIASGQADIVLLAREMLRDPYWPRHAAHKLGVDIKWPVQYERAKP